MWTRVVVSQWYGEGARKVEIVSAAFVWYNTGFEAVPIRCVLVPDLMGKFKTQVLLSTDCADNTGFVRLVFNRYVVCGIVIATKQNEFMKIVVVCKRDNYIF